jgi:hypothetical protein
MPRACHQVELHNGAQRPRARRGLAENPLIIVVLGVQPQRRPGGGGGGGGAVRCDGGGGRCDGGANRLLLNHVFTRRQRAPHYA